MASHDDKRMELTEHLGELRQRLMRSILYLVLGAIVAYQFFTPLYSVIYRPLEREMKRLEIERTHKAVVESGFVVPQAKHNPPDLADYNHLADALRFIHEHPVAPPRMSIVFSNFHEPFMVRLKVSIVFGFILVMPLVVRELGLFIMPALTPQERKPLRALMPLSVFLMLSGVAVAYCTMFFAMHWFLSYLADFPGDPVVLQNANDYVLFFVKMAAAFAIAFQLPVLLMGGAYLGLVTSKGLLKNWRWGVLVAALGGLFTPSNDIISMALMSIPLLMLYFGSIVLVRFVERGKARGAIR